MNALKKLLLLIKAMFSKEKPMVDIEENVVEKIEKIEKEENVVENIPENQEAVEDKKIAEDQEEIVVENQKTVSDVLIILDNGHGEETPGKRSPIWQDGSQLFEYEFNRNIVARIASMLKKEGIEYTVLVPESKDISLTDRCSRANKLTKERNGKTILISVHANAGGGTGWEVWTSPGSTKADEYATILFNEAKKMFPEWKMRPDMSDGDPDKESSFTILAKTNGPAVLTENFFMDTEKDCRLIMSEEGREKVALMHALAIKKMCGV